jgi:hypothetical protein
MAILRSLVIGAILALGQTARTQSVTLGAPYPGDAARIIQEIGQHSKAMANLEELTDDFGPRLTGSDRLRKAQAWAMDKLKSYGAVNVHEEAFPFGQTWIRGRDYARLTNGNGLTLHVAQRGWTPSTNGLVRSEVVVAEVKTLADLDRFAAITPGKVVLMVGFPNPTKEEVATPEAKRSFNRKVDNALVCMRASVLLIPSRKIHGLLTMGGEPATPEKPRPGPIAYIAAEHANLLSRLAKRGKRPEVEVDLGGKIVETGGSAYNVIADFPGGDKRDEVVIIGGHLDSWDLGTGATDDGTGVVAAMETLRAMATLGLKPRRTLRVLLFSGEEQGFFGSKAYVRSHAAELGRIQAVLIDDAGPGRITGWPDQGKAAFRSILEPVLLPVANLGCGVRTEVQDAEGADSDNGPFLEVGVPALMAIQDPLDNVAVMYHSEADITEHVSQPDLIQACQVMSVTAWGLLNVEERLPHQGL